MGKRGPQPILTEEKKQVIYAIMTIGASQRSAADYVHCAPSTISNTAARDPVFAEGLRAARATCETECLRNIFHAGPRSWRASAWLLERIMPGRYEKITLRRPSAKRVAEFWDTCQDRVLQDIPPELHDKIRTTLSELSSEFEEHNGKGLIKSGRSSEAADDAETGENSEETEFGEAGLTALAEAAAKPIKYGLYAGDYPRAATYVPEKIEPPAPISSGPSQGQYDPPDAWSIPEANPAAPYSAITPPGGIPYPPTELFEPQPITDPPKVDPLVSRIESQPDFKNLPPWPTLLVFFIASLALQSLIGLWTAGWQSVAGQPVAADVRVVARQPVLDVQPEVTQQLVNTSIAAREIANPSPHSARTSTQNIEHFSRHVPGLSHTKLLCW